MYQFDGIAKRQTFCSDPIRSAHCSHDGISILWLCVRCFPLDKDILPASSTSQDGNVIGGEGSGMCGVLWRVKTIVWELNVSKFLKGIKVKVKDGTQNGANLKGGYFASQIFMFYSSKISLEKV